MPERCPRCRGLFPTRNGAYQKHIAMCRVALGGGTGDSSGGSEEEIRSDEHRRGGGSPVPVDEQELDEEDAGAPSAAAEGAVNPQVARLRAVLEDPSANPRCLFGEAGWAVLRLWHGEGERESGGRPPGESRRGDGARARLRAAALQPRLRRAARAGGLCRAAPPRL